MLCNAETKSGKPCKKKATQDGFCRIHHPTEIKKREEKHQKLDDKKKKFHEILNVIGDTSETKGWSHRVDNYDGKHYRYATIIVKRYVESNSYSDNKVIGQFNITVNDGIKLTYSKTSFYGHGLSDLQNAIMDEFQKLPWLESKKNKKGVTPAKESIYNLINRFHLVSTQLKRRYSSRETLKIKDEYDVQDLFHGLLKIYFSDVRPEEYSPSRGGASSRLDFLLKNEKIVIEVKMASSKLTDKKIGEQLIIDIERYREHPDCDTLICFVYDPEMHIRNPAGLEKDLSRKEGKLEIKVMVVPQ